MGEPATLLEELCRRTLSLGADRSQVEHKDRPEWVFVFKNGIGFGIANYAGPSADAKGLLGSLYAAAKKPVRTSFGGQVYILKVRIFESFGENCFDVSIKPALKRDPSIAPKFRAKQGQYLAFISTTGRSTAKRQRISLPSIRNYDQDPGAQRPRRENFWKSQVHARAGRTRAPAANGARLLIAL